MGQLSFSPVEKSVSFYTRNDFAILNCLLLGRYEELWDYAKLAYQDNRGILEEYGSGVRTVRGEYDLKWINALRERLIDRLDDETRARILDTARADIANLLAAIEPAAERLSLFRTAWIDNKYGVQGGYAWSREYKALDLTMGVEVEIGTITSCSVAPYREDEDVGSDFWRYEIHVPQGKDILKLDQFICHNEEGEVLLPPMRCRVLYIRTGEKPRNRGIIGLEYAERLPVGKI